MRSKKILIILMTILILLTIFQTISFGADDDIDAIKAKLKDVNDEVAEQGKIGEVINIIIGLLQIAGTGISLIVVTMLGLKYILASPSEKADVKKQIAPIIIGCTLLFGAVQLMGAVYKFSQSVLAD